MWGRFDANVDLVKGPENIADFFSGGLLPQIWTKFDFFNLYLNRNKMKHY